MKRQIVFKLDDTSSFFKNTTDYFSPMGFKKVIDSENQIVFTKGSLLLNMVTFNPLNWKSDIKITLQDSTVVADFDINTTGQVTTPKEEKLWDVFVENYKVSVTNNLNLLTENKQQIKETKRNSIKYLKWALIGGVAFGIPFGILGYFTGIETLASTGAAIGAISFIMWKINEDRKNDIE